VTTQARLSRRAASLLIVLTVALTSAVSASAEPSAIVAKEAEVQSVLGQIQQLDVSLARAIEAYNFATDKLHAIEADLRTNAYELHVAKRNLKRSQRALANRLVAIYTSGEEASVLSILLGAGSIDEMLNQIETVNRISRQDVEINRQVRHFRAQVQAQRIRLRHAQAEQRQVVQERIDAKASIEQQLGERRQLVSSIRAEIERMKAEERRRQAELARQAAAARAAQAEHARQLALANPYASSESSAADPAPAPTVSAPPSSVGGSVVSIAMRYLGIPYVWGGASPSQGFDCSGLTMYVYAQVGISLPHYAASQYGMGVPVSREQLQPGDLVFFNGLGHMGMYIGGGNFIHAPHTGDVVKISSMSDAWYASTYVGARRIL
jgi:peptidoglycan DL-endopeptidase CwlO